MESTSLGKHGMAEPDPETALSTFCAKLGWFNLQGYRHQETRWYESGESDGADSDYFLQVNECPSGQRVAYCGAVYAMRFQICTGWHTFTLFSSGDDIAHEALRVEGWLHKRWFDTSELRQKFTNLHPECANYSWARIQTEGTPYEQKPES